MLQRHWGVLPELRNPFSNSKTLFARGLRSTGNGYWYTLIFFFIQIDKNKNKFKNVILMLFPSLAQVSSLISVVVSREHFILTNQ